jgi:hypothetical protein
MPRVASLNESFIRVFQQRINLSIDFNLSLYMWRHRKVQRKKKDLSFVLLLGDSKDR